MSIKNDLKTYVKKAISRDSRKSHDDNYLYIKEYNGKNIYLRHATPDKIVADSCFDGEFNALMNLLGMLKKEFCVLDLGAYIGTASLIFASLPNSKVVSVEPSADNYSILELNTMIHPNILAVNKAIAPTSNQTLDLSNRGTGQWGFSTVKNPKDSPNPSFLQRVKTISINELIDEYCSGQCPLAAIKIDIEGAEKDVFGLSNDWIEKCPIVLAEIHDYINPGCMNAWSKFLGNSSSRYSIKLEGEKYISLDINLLKTMIR